MPPMDFHPSHPQPFTLDQATQLDIPILVAEISRLENSLAHLRSTQAELESYLREEPGGDEDGELSRAVKENEGVIASQSERITLIKVALLNKVGEGGMRHYGLDDASDAAQSHETRQSGRPPGPPAGAPSEADGTTRPAVGAHRRDVLGTQDTHGDDGEDGVFL